MSPYAHPKGQTPQQQLLWRRAAEEVASLSGDSLPWPLPGAETFCCAGCENPTYAVYCAECLYWDDCRREDY